PSLLDLLPASLILPGLHASLPQEVVQVSSLRTRRCNLQCVLKRRYGLLRGPRRGVCCAKTRPGPDILPIALPPHVLERERDGVLRIAADLALGESHHFIFARDSAGSRALPFVVRDAYFPCLLLARLRLGHRCSPPTFVTDESKTTAVVLKTDLGGVFVSSAHRPQRSLFGFAHLRPPAPCRL